MGDKEKGCVKQVVTVLISVIGLACSSFLVTGLQNYIDVDLVAACATNTPCDTNCKLVVILGAIFYLLIGLQWAWKQHKKSQSKKKGVGGDRVLDATDIV